MNLETFVTWSLPGAFALLAVLEAAMPARRFPDRPHWWLKGLLWFAASFLTASFVAAQVDPLLAPYTLLDISSWGMLPGAVAGFFVYEAGVYAWQRLIHTVPFLWRWHQTHHAAERLDVWSAWHFHPIDLTMFTLVASVGGIVVLGLSLESALLVALAGNTLTMFQHSNLRTPVWLGWFVMRPEQHRAHHERGVHWGNFGDIALFDWLFGTYANPERMDAPVGFYDGASDELGALLWGADLQASWSRGSHGDDAVLQRE